MDSRSRGRKEPHGPLPDFGPLVLVPGVVEEGNLCRSSALRQFGEAPGEGLLRHTWQRAAGVYAGERGGPARETRSCEGVVGRGDQCCERELSADVSCRLLA